MRKNIARLFTALLLGALTSWLAPALAAGADTVSAAVPVAGGTLTSGQAVAGDVAAPAGIEYTFTALSGRHVTLAITNPKVSPKGEDLQMEVLNSRGFFDANRVLIGTGNTEIDFTPDPGSAGTTTVVISPFNAPARGSFTLTYATDVTGALTSGVATQGTLKYQGQNADYTFTAVAGRHVTLAITNPKVSPVGEDLQMEVFNSSGDFDANRVLIGTGSTEIDFTPDAGSAGITTVVISPFDGSATGSFTLTYATDVTGALTSGVATIGTLKYQGQNADYTFTAVAGRHVTLAITNPKVSPVGEDLQMEVLNSSGYFDANRVFIGTGATGIDFTPDAGSAGTTTVIISPFDSGTTGSFTLTYTVAAP
jgi:hypothetical protein